MTRRLRSKTVIGPTTGGMCLASSPMKASKSLLPSIEVSVMKHLKHVFAGIFDVKCSYVDQGI